MSRILPILKSPVKCVCLPIFWSTKITIRTIGHAINVSYLTKVQHLHSCHNQLVRGRILWPSSAFLHPRDQDQHQHHHRTVLGWTHRSDSSWLLGKVVDKSLIPKAWWCLELRPSHLKMRSHEAFQGCFGSNPHYSKRTLSRWLC